MALHLEVVTPNGTVLTTEADYVGVTGVAGQFGLMPGHIPLLSALAIGRLYYRTGSTQKDLFISGGFAEVSKDKVVILAESAEESENINTERAQAARDRAENRIKQAKNDENIDLTRAKLALARAMARLNIASCR